MTGRQYVILLVVVAIFSMFGGAVSSRFLSLNAGAEDVKITTNVKQEKAVSASKFLIVDEEGTVRAGISAEGLFLYDEEGENRAGITAKGLVFFDEKGRNRVTLYEKGLVFFDEKNTGRTVIYEGAIEITDEKGKTIYKAPVE